MDQIVAKLQDFYDTNLAPLGLTGLLIALMGLAVGAALAGYIARKALIFVAIAVGVTLLLDNADAMNIFNDVTAEFKRLMDRYL